MIEETYQAEGVISMTNTSLENRLFYDLEHSMRDGIIKDRVFYLLKWYQKKEEWYKVLTYIATALSILFPAVLALLNIPALTRVCSTTPGKKPGGYRDKTAQKSSSATW